MFGTLILSAQKRFINSIHLDFFGNQVDGDGYSGYNHVGLHGGVGSLYKFKNSKGALGFEINYAQKGARLWPRPNQGIYQDFKFHLNYIEVPVYYVFESWGLPFEIGPSFSYLLDAEREFNGIPSVLTSPYREYELGGIFSMTYPITEQLFFKFRVTNSISPILNVENGSFANWAAGSWHRGAGLNITYFFSPPNFKASPLSEVEE
jgi:hypothetical protein